MKKTMMLLLAGFLLMAQAWASQKSITEVTELVQEQTGHDAGVAGKGTDIPSVIESLLAQPLSEDATVKITFLNSPLVKAELSSLGISESDMREAGLLHNPTASFSSRTSNEGGKRNTEIEVKQDVMDVLFWPLRKQAAGTRFKAAQYEAAQKIVDVLKGSRLTYLEWVAAIDKRKLAKDHFTAQEAAVEISRRQKEAGNINTLQLAAAQTIFQRAKIEWLKSQQEVHIAAQRLRGGLGLRPDQFFMEESLPLPDLPDESIELGEIEKKALDHRLDVRMKRHEIKALEQSVNLAALGIIPELGVGYNQETESSGGKVRGIVVEGEVPIFNRKQAQRMGIKAAIEMSKHQLNAMEQQALLDVRVAYQRLTTSRHVAEAYTEVIPTYQKIVKETLYQYNFMLKDVFHLLEAKQAELETQEAYVDALKEYWAARAELEYAAGVKVPFTLPAKPTTNEPAVKEHQHVHGG